MERDAMKRSKNYRALTMLIAMLAAGATASADVHDNAKLFSADAVSKADRDIAVMKAKHNKDLNLDTFSAVPADQKANLNGQDSSTFFEAWAAQLGKEHNGNGVEILICMDPVQITVLPGKETRERGDFTVADSASVRKAIAPLMHGKQYDQALAKAVSEVDTVYTDNIVGDAPGTRHTTAQRGQSGNTGQYPGRGPVTPAGTSMFGFSIGTLLCLGVGLVIIFSLVKAILSRAGSGGQNYGGGGYGNSGYQQGPGPGYGGPGYGGPGYGGGGGGGGGFGRGFLGGLLGGAVGGYAADKFEHRNDAPAGGSASYGGDAGSNNNSGDSGSGSYDSGPSDAGDFSGGGGSSGDFGGGGDSGGGGGDSGGDSGGSSGGF
jgi:hypothetical protein